MFRKYLKGYKTQSAIHINNLFILCFLFADIFLRSCRAVPIEVCDKLGVESLRDLAEEGLYVCQKPNVNKSELKLIEKRLLNDDKYVYYTSELK